MKEESDIPAKKETAAEVLRSIEASLREKMKCSLRNKITARRKLVSYTEDELELVEAELMGDIDDLIQQEIRDFVLGLEATTAEFEEEANTSEDDEEVQQCRFYWGPESEMIFYDDDDDGIMQLTTALDS